MDDYINENEDFCNSCVISGVVCVYKMYLEMPPISSWHYSFYFENRQPRQS